MLKYKIKVMNYFEAFKYVYNHCGYCKNKNFAIISIQEYSNEVMGVVYKPGGHLKAALNIHFSDLDKENSFHDNNPELNLMTEEDALKIKVFIDGINEFNDLDELIIHCHAGVSRSAAVAAAILKVYNDDDSQIFDSENHAPNMYVYTQMLKAYGLKNDGDIFLETSYSYNDKITF